MNCVNITDLVTGVASPVAKGFIFPVVTAYLASPVATLYDQVPLLTCTARLLSDDELPSTLWIVGIVEYDQVPPQTFPSIGVTFPI